MSKTDSKKPANPPAVPAKYSEEMPTTPQQRERAMPEFVRDVEAKEKGPDPRDATAPYGGGTTNGTDDSSRFSTPPPKRS